MSFIKELPKLDKIFTSIYRILLFLLAMVSVYSLGFIPTTNSFFTDKASLKNISFNTGYWIPVLTYSVDPENPDGKNGWYMTHPCVSLSAVIGNSHDGITIYYKFSHDDDPVFGGIKYKGTCVDIPDGEVDFEAQAVNDENPDDWRSNIIKLHFKVDTNPPDEPDWDSPKDDAWTHQVKDIKISWEEPSGDPAGYIYEVNEPKDDSGWKEPYSTCGLINDTHVPTSQSCFHSYDVKLDQGDGKYKRRVKSVDENKNESEWSKVATINLDTLTPATVAKSAKINKSDPNIITINYDAQDNPSGSGVKNVTLYYRFQDENGHNSDGWQKYLVDNSPSGKIDFNIDETIGTIETEGKVTFEFYTIGEDSADDLTASDMTFGNGDDGKGNVEDKGTDPDSETSSVWEVDK